MHAFTAGFPVCDGAHAWAVSTCSDWQGAACASRPHDPGDMFEIDRRAQPLPLRGAPIACVLCCCDLELHRSAPQPQSRSACVPIVLLSGAPDLTAVAARVGTLYHLAKPYTYETLMSLVQRALTERAAPRPPGPAGP